MLARDGVLGHRLDVARHGRAGPVQVGPFPDGPTVVLATLAGLRLVVDLFPRALSDVADEEVARGAVEAEPPRIAQTIRPDLLARRRSEVGVVRRDRVAFFAAD